MKMLESVQGSVEVQAQHLWINIRIQISVKQQHKLEVTVKVLKLSVQVWAQVTLVVKGLKAIWNIDFYRTKCHNILFFLPQNLISHDQVLIQKVVSVVTITLHVYTTRPLMIGQI